MSELNGYQLSRAWFDFAFENQGKITGNHCAMLMWFIEQNNRMGWAKEFGAPREQTMAAIGISSYNTYKKVFNDLVGWGFIRVVKESKNQWSAHIIALSKFDKPLDKALDKALSLPYQNLTDQSESIQQGTDTGSDTGTVAINKPLNNETNKLLVVGVEGEPEEVSDSQNKFDEAEYQSRLNFFKSSYLKKQLVEKQKISEEKIYDLFRDFYEQKFDFGELKNKNHNDIARNFYYWVPIHLNSEKEKSSAKKEKGATGNQQQLARGVAAAMKFADVKMWEDKD